MAESTIEERVDLAWQPAARREAQPPAAGRRIGFVSTRLCGTDGVSLETRKWAHILAGAGHHLFYFAGLNEQPAEHCHTVGEAAFDHAAVQAVNGLAFGAQPAAPAAPDPHTPPDCHTNGAAPASRLRPPAVTRRIRELTDHLKAALYHFVRAFDVDLLVVENALSIPMNLALGVALTELIGETGLPTIAHHHDFYWERKRFQANCVADYLDMAFPPRLPSVRHVVINSLAAQQLAWRKGLAPVVIPNVMDFDQPPPPGRGGLRAALGLRPEELFILQPTRVIQRKGIEHAIELCRRLGRPARLVISHASGDEGDEYARRLREYAQLLGVGLVFADGLLAGGAGGPLPARFELGDFYAAADLVTYPSLEEGFGNALLEAFYYQRPVVVNNYLVHAVDVKPKGFRVIEFEDFITDCTVRQARQVLDDPALARAMTDANFALGRQHYAYAVAARRLSRLIEELLDDHP